MIRSPKTARQSRLPDFVTESRTIYTHFLNRELLRSVNLGLDDANIERILRILLACTTERFLSSIAFVWEISTYLPKTLNLLEQLHHTYQLDLVSNLPTVDEFISYWQIKRDQSKRGLIEVRLEGAE